MVHFVGVLGDETVKNRPHPGFRKLQLLLGLLGPVLLFSLHVRPVLAADSSLPEEELSPRIWVVVGIATGEGQGWNLSGFYAGRGELTLRWAWVDPEGKHRAEGEFRLEGGRSADLRLAAPPRGDRPGACALVVSGLDLDPDWVILSLWRSSSGAGGGERTGAWLFSDPSWTAARKTGS